MKQEISDLLETLISEIFGVKLEVILTRPDEQFGDFATNIAMKISALLRSQNIDKSPRLVADDIVEALMSDKYRNKNIASVSIAGPGFINIHVPDAVLFELVHSALDAGSKYGKTTSLRGKQVVAEYSDPNPFKVLHAGHLYTTLVGDSVARIVENAGATVHRVNFGGDVGLHVGKCMWAILQDLGGELPDKLNVVSEASRLDWLSARYVEGSTAYEEDAIAKREIVDINKKVYSIHSNNDIESAFAKIYWTCRQWSYDGFDRLYSTWGVTPFEKYIPESLTVVGGVDLVEKGLEKDVFAESDGAIIFKGEEKGLHTRVFINSEGLPTYETKDLGLAALKWQTYHFDLGIIITANDITEYMKVVLSALSSFYPEIVERTRHLTHGVIKLSGGIKMSSRKGNILRAVDIIESARESAKALSQQNDDAVVLGAIKYAFLKQRIGGDIVYNPSESVSTEGNSGPYLQYSYARACSILSKAKRTPSTEIKTYKLAATEKALLKKIDDFTDVTTDALHDLMPHHLCTYLYELAQIFNRFYENNRVLDDEHEAQRLTFIEAYKVVLGNGLNLLGIDTLEKM